MLDAAEQLILREGSAAATMTRIAEVAGVSIGSLYQYFPNRPALLVLLAERYMAADLAEFRALQAQAPTLSFEALIAALAHAMMEAYARNAALRAVLIHEIYATGSDGKIRDIFAEYEAELLALVRAHVDNLDEPALRRRIFVAFYAAEGVMREAAMRRLDPDERRQIAALVTAAFLRTIEI